MKAIKKILNNIFIDGLSGMALGLFSTLIIGTILKQIGDLMGGTYGAYLSTFAVIAQRLTGAGIGIGVAYKFRESTYVLLSAAAAGMIGAYASNLIAGTLLSDTGALVLAGPGEPLGAFVAAYVGITVGRLVAGKTKLDLLITPAVTILSGGTVGILVGPGVSRFMTWLGNLVNWGTEQQPVLMGIIVSVVMGMVLTLPISSAALGIILGLNGVAAGAATIGCCCQMIGFAVTSFKDNGVGGLFAQGVGTSMLQIPCNFRSHRYYRTVPYDKQCHWLRHGNLRPGWTDHDLPDHDSDRGACAGYFENHSISFPASRSAVLCDLSRNAQHGIYQGRSDEAGCVKRRELSLRSKCIFWHHKACCRAKWTVICL